MKKPVLLTLDEFMQIDQALDLAPRKPSLWERIINKLWADHPGYYF